MIFKIPKIILQRTASSELIQCLLRKNWSLCSRRYSAVSWKAFNKVLNLNDVMLKLIYTVIIHFVDHLKVNLISDEIERKISTAMENKYLLNQFIIWKKFGLLSECNYLMVHLIKSTNERK